MNFLNRFEGSIWFRGVRAGLLGLALWLLAEDSTAEAQKAANQPVTALDVPASAIGAIGLVVGFLKGGEKNA